MNMNLYDEILSSEFKTKKSVKRVKFQEDIDLKNNGEENFRANLWKSKYSSPKKSRQLKTFFPGWATKSVKLSNKYNPVSNANSVPVKFLDKLNCTFFDNEEKINFKITNICTCSNYPGCYFYEYYNYNQCLNLPSNKNLLEYTPCDEMLSGRSTWVQWTD